MELFKKKFDTKVYGWKRKDGLPNVGDELAKKIVKEILLFRDIDKNKFSKKYKGKLLSIGSVMHFAKNNDVVWGTGINGKVDERLHKFTKLDVRAVRGPLTRKFLLERNIEVPEIYGDPALLSPLFFSKKTFFINEIKKPFLVIPHMSELDLYKNKFPKDFLCSPLSNPYDFIAQLLSAEKIYSSSLHGIILAEAYGIPVTWIQSENGEDNFKYKDYYEGTGRDFNSIETESFYGFECWKFKKIPDLDAIQKKLIKSFPFEFWNQGN